MKGTIKFYNRDKRFGFITAEDGKDYFFHESGLTPGTSVKDNDKITFEIVEGDRGPKAEKVKLAAKGADDEGSDDEVTEDEDFSEEEEVSEEFEEENIE